MVCAWTIRSAGFRAPIAPWKNRDKETAIEQTTSRNRPRDEENRASGEKT
jgi:hypothetical protein